MTSLLLFLQHVGLAFRLHAATPLDAIDSIAHVHAAMAAATDQVPAELLLGMAYVESRFNRFALSRIERGHRVMGVWPSREPPRYLTKNTSMFCGVTQTRAFKWDVCLERRNLDVAYSMAASELGNWLRDRRVRGNLDVALAGYACGNHGVKTGKCNRYPARVKYQARRFAVTIGAKKTRPRPRTHRGAPSS